MISVTVTSGTILHDDVKYGVGDELEVSEERAARWEKLKVAKVVQAKPVQESAPEPEPVEEKQPEVTQEAEATEHQMIVEDAPFKKAKKRGRKKRG